MPIFIAARRLVWRHESLYTGAIPLTIFLALDGRGAVQFFLANQRQRLVIGSSGFSCFDGSLATVWPTIADRTRTDRSRK